MGLHIIVYKLKGSEQVSDCGYDGEIDMVERQDWFDSLRYAGDKDFVINNEFSYIGSEKLYHRPANFDKCFEWVKDNIPPQFNSKRLLDILNKMREDESLVFRFSW